MEVFLTVMGTVLYAERKQRRAEQESSVSETNVPRGYSPQKALLFDYPLQDRERLIATFTFTPAKWTKLLGESQMYPRPLGMTLGIGHVTSERVLLFYDIKMIHGKSTMSGGSIETIGKYGSKILEHGVNETLGKLFEAFTHLDSETREYMEKVAHKFGPHGVVALPRSGSWALSNGCVFCGPPPPEISTYPTLQPAFAPDFIDYHGSGHRQRLFQKILCCGNTDIELDQDDDFPFFGSRSDLKRAVF